MASPNTPKTPSTFEQRYDRSTRLWGADGQKLLAESHVLLLGASATGCEILKNIVLPGLGRFTIVDDAPVTKADLGKNYFLRPDSVGKNIAEEASSLLKELNPFVEGHFFPTSVRSFVDNGGNGFLHGHVSDEYKNSADPIFDRPKLFSRPSWKATHIIVSSNRVPIDILQKLCNTNTADVPIFYVGVNGLLGSMRIFAPPTPIVDTVPGPDEKLFDPRVVHPFPKLVEMFESLNPEDKSMDHNTFFHLPWPAIVYHALKKWRANAQSDSSSLVVPKSFNDFKAIKQVITDMSKLQTDPEKPGASPEGFDEAKTNLTSCFNFNIVASELREVLDQAADRAAQKNAAPFWIFMNAIKEFREEKGYLPIQPALPDFTTTTQIYLAMSRAFKGQEEVEMEDIYNRAVKFLKEKHGVVDQAAIDAKIDKNAAANICRNIRFVQYQEYPGFEAEVGMDLSKPFCFESNKSSSSGCNPDQCFSLKVKSNEGECDSLDRAAGWYTAIRAAMLFAYKKNTDKSSNTVRFPGQVTDATSISDSVAAEESETVSLARKIFADCSTSQDGAVSSQNSGNCNGSLPDDIEKQVKEIVRYGGSEMGHLAAIMGANASQEIIKFIQSKRVPATPWIIFDGNTSKFIQIEQQ